MLPATVGEVWMVGYLLVRGVRRTAGDVADPVAGQAGKVSAAG